MDSLSNAKTAHILTKEASLLDLLFPGFMPVASSLRSLLTNAPSPYGRLLCLCVLLAFLGKYGTEYFGGLLETHYSQSIRSRPLLS